MTLRSAKLAFTAITCTALGFVLGCCAFDPALADGVQVVEITCIPTATPEPIPAPAPTPVTYTVCHFEHDAATVDVLCRLLYESCCQTGDLFGKSQLLWMLYNRTVDESGLFADSMADAALQKGEFAYYDKDADITDENRALVIDVLDRIESEKLGYNAGRTLPAGYVYQRVNAAHDGYDYLVTKDGRAWAGSVYSPYGG